jgi:hypothetical protein
VLVIEDGILQAQMTAQTLQQAGAWVLGPYGDIFSALRGVARQKPMCAILDFSVNGIPDFRIAHALHDKRIPFFFVTALDPHLVPPDLSDAIILERPLDQALIVETVTIVAARRGACDAESIVARRP